jgi:hypothetical protein
MNSSGQEHSRRRRKLREVFHKCQALSAATSKRSLPMLPFATSTTALEMLAASFGVRHTLGEIEALSEALVKLTEERRREAEGGRVAVLAGYRDAWEPERNAS